MSDGEHEVVVESGAPPHRYLHDLWSYRELFLFLAWRDILVRYKQTVIGVAWSVVRPVLTMVVFTIVFGRLAKLDDQGVPYTILVFSAMLPWQFFSNVLSESAHCLVNNAPMISKVYFPRIILPTSTMLVSLVDLVISSVILVCLMGFLRFVPSVRMLLLPAFFVMVAVTALGAGLWVSALNVKYRDFRYVVPFILQFGVYISPVGFSSEIVPAPWRWVFSLNPMVGGIDGFRWCILGGSTPLQVPGLLVSLGVSLSIFISGVYYFRRTEREFADVI